MTGKPTLPSLSKAYNLPKAYNKQYNIQDNFFVCRPIPERVNNHTIKPIKFKLHSYSVIITSLYMS